MHGCAYGAPEGEGVLLLLLPTYAYLLILVRLVLVLRSVPYFFVNLPKSFFPAVPRGERALRGKTTINRFGRVRTAASVQLSALSALRNFSLIDSGFFV
jgi:hypothetical protein